MQLRTTRLKHTVGRLLVAAATLIVVTGARAMFAAANEAGSQIDTAIAAQYPTLPATLAGPCPAVIRWAGKVWQDLAAPAWKRNIARRLVLNTLQGKPPPTPLRFRATWYCPDDKLDKTGGGFTTASGLPIAFGLASTDNRHWPFGTVFYCDELGISLIVADNGPGVRGPRHVDVSCPDATAIAKFNKAAVSDRHGRRHLTLRYIGRIKLAQLRHR